MGFVCYSYLMKDVPSVYVKDRKALRAWLLDNYQKQSSVWLVFEKGPTRTITYDDIVEEVLCFGWIDSVQRRVSDTQTSLYLSKRKQRSVWAKTNKVRVARLIEAKQMLPAGLAAIETAKANGMWQQLDKSDSLETPPHMEKLLAANKVAAQNYHSFPASAKRATLEWIYAAKQEATMQRRIEQTVALAAKGQRARG